ncbi:MAG TPA: LPS export ABC transporter permease LptF [Burkholderiales bacterium]
MIIHRAFYREAAQTTAAIVFVLLAVLLLYGFTATLGRSVRGDYAQAIVLRLLGWQTLRRFDLLLPLGFYLGALLTLSRWYRDSEMTVLAACGISLVQMLKPVLALAAVGALLTAGASFYLTPLATRMASELRAEGSQRPELFGIAAGVFTEGAAGGRVLYAERVAPDGGMQQVFVHNPGKGRPRVVLSRHGSAYLDPESGARYVRLEDGWAYEGTPGAADYRIVRFGVYTVRLDPRQVAAGPASIEALPTDALLGLAGSEAAGERHGRLAKPLLVFVLAFYALVLAHTDARRGRLLNLFAAILVYFIYSNLLGLGETWLKRGALPAALGLWWVHGAMLAIALFLLYRRNRNRPLLPRLRLASAS